MPPLPNSPPSTASAPATCSSPFPAPPRQLTRARKLRHLQDHEVSDFDFDPLNSPPSEGRAPVNTSAAASSARSSVDTNGADVNSVRPSTAVPHPLPLPDLAALLLVSDRNKEPSVVFRLPFPVEAKEGDRGRARGREKESKRENSSEVSGSGISHRDARINWDAPRNVDHVETWLLKNMPQNGMGVDRAQEGFGVQVPFRSAPATAYSSPILSPPRPSAGDLVLPCHISPQVWPSSERLSQDMSSQDMGIFSLECSPVPSPGVTSPLRSRNTSRGTSPVRPKLFIDASNLHLDNKNGTLSGHPLPLPPGAAALSPSQPIFKMSALASLPSQTSTLSSPNPQISAQSSPLPQIFSGQSSPSSQITLRSELLPRKNQWNKGKLIGRGTFGSVYVATNRETGALCAMKEVELCPDDTKSIESMKQLEQEIKVLSYLKHPNIVQYYGSEIVDDKFYIYLEYVYPGSINKYVREHCGSISESIVRNFTRHILSGLAYLHGTKTIHRDIKGANLLVDAFGVVKLADFGMAKHLTGQAADLSFKGSPYWMAPELMQAVMERDNSSGSALAVDIWSLGCTVIEMLTGRPPWSEYEGAAALFKVLKESPLIPETLSAEGKDFLRCCFQRNPAQRPSASKLLEHPFLRNSQHLDVPHHLPLPASSGSLTMDITYGGRELPALKLDQMPTSPPTRTTLGKLVPNKQEILPACSLLLHLQDIQLNTNMTNLQSHVIHPNQLLRPFLAYIHLVLVTSISG